MAMSDERCEELVRQLADEFDAKYTRLWTAVEAMSGFNDLKNGLADLAGLIEPISRSMPTQQWGSPSDDVYYAIEETRIALGMDADRRPLGPSLPVDDQPVGFIGQPRPRPVPRTGARAGRGTRT